MSQLNWMEIIGWNEKNLDDIRSTAFIYIREGKYHIAQDFFESLTILNPQNPYDLQTLGSIYLQQNKPKLAYEYLMRAKDLDPQNKIIELNRIKALLMLGYRNQALTLIDRFIPECTDPFMANDAEALKLAYA